MKNTWTLQTPEVTSGDYFFDGQPHITRGAFEKLSAKEAALIIHDLRTKAKANNGIDYLQVFKNQDGERIWVMDQLTRAQIAAHDADWVATNHFFTILLPSEY